jgi:hypothetical protein
MCWPKRRIRGKAMDIVGWIMIGLLAAVAGELILPGRSPGGITVRLLVGATGALLGRFLAAVPPRLPEAVLDLSRAVKALATYLEEPGGPDETRRFALEAARKATEILEERHDRAVSVLVGQVRSAAVDILRSTGMDQASALQALEGPPVAPQRSAEPILRTNDPAGLRGQLERGADQLLIVPSGVAVGHHQRIFQSDARVVTPLQRVPEHRPGNLTLAVQEPRRTYAGLVEYPLNPSSGRTRFLRGPLPHQLDQHSRAAVGQAAFEQEPNILRHPESRFHADASV